jgi:uncharacterized membrane protein YdjX (TVP38/TMEM64 family)
MPDAAHDVFLWLEAHRHAWYALPLVIASFIALGLLPATVLVTATGIAFGPVLGPLYAMAGCLAAASTAFLIGRRVGRHRVERLGGARVLKVTRKLKKNGVLAVFIIRKVPAPFALVNMAVGASTIRYRDFLLGSFLGLLAMVIGLAGFGAQALDILHDPTPMKLTVAALFIAFPLAAAWAANRMLRARHAK